MWSLFFFTRHTALMVDWALVVDYIIQMFLLFQLHLLEILLGSLCQGGAARADPQKEDPGVGPQPTRKEYGREMIPW